MTMTKLCISVDWDRHRFCIEDHAGPQAYLHVRFDPYNVARGFSPMSTIITDTQKVIVSVTFQDKKGNPATIDGLPEWSSSDPTIATVEPSEDGYSATVFAVGPIGHSQIAVSADARLGEEVNIITGLLELDVVGGEAVSANLTAGTPEEQE